MAPGAYIICAGHEIRRTVGSDEHGILLLANRTVYGGVLLRLCAAQGVPESQGIWRAGGLITPPSKPFSLWTHSGLVAVRL